jgi:hypothetical protein
MRLIRSWPATIPPNRSYVIDGMERLVMSDYSYRVLDDIADDVVLFEWDVAVGKVELDTWLARSRAEPERVRVGPYQIHESFTGRAYQCHPLWAHRLYNPGEASVRFVTPDDKTCHLFGFGMVYLPRLYVERFLEFWPGHFDDVAFSGWHYRNADDPEVPIDWDCAPVHLHYPVPEVQHEQADR